MDQKQKRRLLVYIYSTLVLVAVAGFSKIINVPSIPPLFYQSLLILCTFAAMNEYRNYKDNQQDLLNIQNGLKRSLLQQNSQQLEAFTKAQTVSLLRSCQIEVESRTPSKTSPKSKKTGIALAEKKSEPNIILLSLALHIMKMNAIKLGTKTLDTKQKDLDYIVASSDGELPVIIKRTSLYLQELQHKFGDQREFDWFLSQLLKENNFFLDESLKLTNLQTHFDTALSKFTKDLEKADKKAQDLINQKPFYQKNPLPADDIFTAAEFPITRTPSMAGSQPSSYNEEKSSTISTIASSEFDYNIETLLKDCGIGPDDYIIEDTSFKSQTLEIDPEKRPLFIKIFKRKTESLLKKSDESFLITPTILSQLSGIAPAIIKEYQLTPEYVELKTKNALGKMLDTTDEFRLQNQQELPSHYLTQWRKFSDNQRAEEQKQQELALHNHQQFAEFLNGADYLKNLAQEGNIYLKGSYLYGDLLNLNKARARDIDLEIHIPDLFSTQKTPQEIKEIIKANFDFEIKDDTIKISTEHSYAQFQFTTATGKIVDLSFYDKNKLPTYDWIYGADALRLDLTKTLKSPQEITTNQLSQLKPSLSRGFALQYPNTEPETVLKIIKSGNQLTNSKTRDLLFNTIKRVAKGVLTIEEVKSLYENNQEFKESLKKDLNSMIANLSKLPDKCEKSDININSFNNIIIAIGMTSSPLITNTPATKTSSALVATLQDQQTLQEK